MPTFDTVLIANRGEIASRIIRTLRRLGLKSVAVYSDADAAAPFVRQADASTCIGPAPAFESYLAIDRILAAARQTGAGAIHPGYGFLAENAAFAEACEAIGIVFIGPSVAAMRTMGAKDAAKVMAQSLGVPVVPGYHGTRQNNDFLRKQAMEIGYPVLVKAVSGGGGKGMKRVDEADGFEAACAAARREAKSAFGDDIVLIEKYIPTPRHVEVQVFGDRHGNVVHLFDRDCSLQRRHQKVIEEAPAPGLSHELRNAMAKAATDLARAVDYAGAGTVEFLVAGEAFYFLEMNTRLQVEHPVTEEITGLDLVEWQIRVAQGERLPFGQGDIVASGHSFEARLYAEDPASGFLPSTGVVAALTLPEDEAIRLEAAIGTGSNVSTHYDPMLAKIITWGLDRTAALKTLQNALETIRIAGVKTNLPLLRRLCSSPAFHANPLHTGFIDEHIDEFTTWLPERRQTAIAAGAAALVRQRMPGDEAMNSSGWMDPWADNRAFQLGKRRETRERIVVDGEPLLVSVTWGEAGPQPASGALPMEIVRGEGQNQGEMFVLDEGWHLHIAQTRLGLPQGEAEEGEADIKAPLNGRVVAVYRQVGDRVARGERLFTIEAMKMEHILTASQAGTILELSAQIGEQVRQGATLAVLSQE